MLDANATLKGLTTPELIAFLAAASAAYYNTSAPVVSDDLYDLVKEELTRRDPKNAFLAEVGAAPGEDGAKKVELPYYMGSLDKIREDPKALTKFVAAYPGDYVLMDKLDGNSALLTYGADGRPSGLYSRGNGTVGQTLAHLLPLVRGIPERATPGLAVRGELILSRADWERLKHLGANARNVVAGTMNKKTPNPDIARAMTFVAYEIRAGGGAASGAAGRRLSEDLAALARGGFTTVYWESLDASQMTMDDLSDRLVARRAGSPYEVDGVVVSHDAPHKVVAGKNPKHAFAFKSLLTHDEAEVIVSAVEWNVSKDGFLKPTVLFNPVVLNGVTIQRATGFNAGFIEAQKIGPGGRIVIIRSGDVIPKIQRVLTPAASGRGALPEGAGEPGGPQWNETHVDLKMAPDGIDPEYAKKQMEHFAVSLEMPSVAAGTIKKMYDNGVTSVAAMLRVTAEDLAKMEGFQRTLAEKVATAIAEAKARATCADLMVASNAFGRGFGTRKIALILGAFPDRRMPDDVPTVAELSAVKGIGPKTATEFVEGIGRFRAFLRETGLTTTCSAAPAAGPAAPAAAAPTGALARLAGAKIVFTGFRAKDWEARIAAVGGQVSSSVSRATTLVVAADPDKVTGKVADAQKYAIRVMGKDAFAAEYGL